MARLSPGRGFTDVSLQQGQNERMDSLTQVALGAAVGEAVLGHRVGRKAALWGAICGTLPDLDVLVPFADPVANFTYHRSFSHSLFVMLLATPLLVWLIRKLHPADAEHRWGWAALVYLSLATHALLDAFTIYGTQLFWPLTEYPVTWGTVFIIDPLVTLPLLFGLAAVILSRKNPQRGYRINAVTLGLATGYLAWSVGAQLYVQGVAERALAAQGIETTQVLAQPGPFNTILWRIVAMGEDGYHEGWYSLLDEHQDLSFDHHPSDADLLAGIEDHWPVQRLQWFTKGYYRVRDEGGDIVITDLRMGVEGGYVFSFKVGERVGDRSQRVAAVQRAEMRSFESLGPLWERLKGVGPPSP